MTALEVYSKIKPFLEGNTEGLFWDFKKTIHPNQIPDIIKDIMAFSNSNFDGDSYIIVGVSEPNTQKEFTKIPLDAEDRNRLQTDANYLYFSGKWNIHGLNAEDINKMKQFSGTLSDQMSSYMLISQPECEYVPIQIGKSRWLFVIVVKNKPGVFISKKDIMSPYDDKKVVIKQGVLYVRMADTTLGAKTEAAMATEYIRIWKKYIKWLENTSVENLVLEVEHE